MGNKLVRKKLFMSAMVCMRRDIRIKKMYESLLSRSKKKKVALTALMRKILIITHSLYKNNTDYDPQYNACII